MTCERTSASERFHKKMNSNQAEPTQGFAAQDQSQDRIRSTNQLEKKTQRARSQSGATQSTTQQQNSLQHQTKNKRNITLIRQSGRDMKERVRVLVDERRQNKSKINELSGLIEDLNNRLYLAERKTAVTANIGKRQASELRREVQDLSEQIVQQKNQERHLKRKMEELHFTNMVQYEASLKQQASASFVDLEGDEPSRKQTRLMHTINPDSDDRHKSQSIQVVAQNQNFMTLDNDGGCDNHSSHSGMYQPLRQNMIPPKPNPSIKTIARTQSLQQPPHSVSLVTHSSDSRPIFQKQRVSGDSLSPRECRTCCRDVKTLPSSQKRLAKTRDNSLKQQKMQTIRNSVQTSEGSLMQAKPPPPNQRKVSTNKRQKQPISQRKNSSVTKIRTAQQRSDSKEPVEQKTTVSEELVKTLREEVAVLQKRVKDVEADRDEWRSKAKNLATNFMGALKDLKKNLYAVKRDQQEGMQDLRAEFNDRLSQLTAQIHTDLDNSMTQTANVPHEQADFMSSSLTSQQLQTHPIGTVDLRSEPQLETLHRQEPFVLTNNDGLDESYCTTADVNVPAHRRSRTSHDESRHDQVDGQSHYSAEDHNPEEPAFADMTKQQLEEPPLTSTAGNSY